MLTDYHLHLRPDEEGTTAERYFTAENVERYLGPRRAAGIAELGVSEHVYRFRQALDLWQPPALGRERRRRPRRLLRVRPHDPAAARDRVRLRPRRRGAHRGAAGGARLRLRRRLGPLHRRGRRRRRPRRLRRLGGQRATRTRSGAATSRRFAAAPAPASSTSSPTRTWSRSGVAPRPLPEGDLRALLRARGRSDRRGRLAVELSTAGLRKPVGELYPARGFAELCVEAGVLVRALLRRPPARAGRLRLRPRGRVPRRARGRARSPSSRAAAAAWRRWPSRVEADDRDRLRQPPLRAGAHAWSSAGSRSSTSSDSRATPTPTSSPTR